MSFITTNAEDSKKTKSTFVVGDQKTGKTYQAYQLLKGLNPLVITFNGAEFFYDYPGVTYLENPTLTELDTEVLKAITGKAASMKPFGAILFKGLYQYSQMVLQDVVGTGTVVQQRDWGIMSQRVLNNLLILKNAKPVMTVTCLTELDESKTPPKREAVINRQLWNTVVPHFSNVIYTAAKIEGANISYTVQRNTTLAIKFIPAQPEPKPAAK